MASLTKDQILALVVPWISDFIILTGSINSSGLFRGTYKQYGAQALQRITQNTMNKWYGTYVKNLLPAGAAFKIKPTIKPPKDRDSWRKEFARLQFELIGIFSQLGASPGISVPAVTILYDLYKNYISIDPV